jgi:hypothetical protein
MNGLLFYHMFQQQPMDEDVAATDFAQEDAVGGVVKEAA